MVKRWNEFCKIALISASIFIEDINFDIDNIKIDNDGAFGLSVIYVNILIKNKLLNV